MEKKNKKNNKKISPYFKLFEPPTTLPASIVIEVTKIIRARETAAELLRSVSDRLEVLLVLLLAEQVLDLARVGELDSADPALLGLCVGFIRMEKVN